MVLRGSEFKKLMRKQETFEEILVQQQIKIKQLEKEKIEAFQVSLRNQNLQQRIKTLQPQNPGQIISQRENKEFRESRDAKDNKENLQNFQNVPGAQNNPLFFKQPSSKFNP